MRNYDFLGGEVLAFDKPYGWTSFNLVKMVRNRLSRRLGVARLKVGHAGTLDPLATGVLLVCTGRATKEIDTLQAGTKEYIATLRLGCTTPSFDAEQPIDVTYPTGHITRTLVEETLGRFRGSIMQVPPVYSACKVEGRRAFDYAREGSDIALKPKELVIDEMEILDLHLPEQGLVSPHADDVARIARDGISIKACDRRKPLIEDSIALCNSTSGDTPAAAPPYLTLRVVCSKGTYIRALARDIGQALGSGAYLLALRRTRVGDHGIGDCMTVEGWEEWVATVPVVAE